MASQSKNSIGRASIGAAGVRVPDLRGEEFEEAIGGALAGGGDDRRQADRWESGELVQGVLLHAYCTSGSLSSLQPSVRPTTRNPLAS